VRKPGVQDGGETTQDCKLEFDMYELTNKQHKELQNYVLMCE
jgi:hypothetical protein